MSVTPNPGIAWAAMRVLAWGLTLAPAAAARAQPPACFFWTLGPDAGEPRAGHGIAFDAGRGVSVVAGGLLDAGTNGDTAEWDGSGWRWRADAPFYAAHASMVYVPFLRRSMILGASNERGVTWLWDGKTWEGAPDPALPQLTSYALACDTRRGLAVMFGGIIGSQQLVYSDQTWEWDGASWRRVLAAGPPPMAGAAMVYDSARGESVLFGGGNGPIFSGVTWAWDGVAWTRRATQGPSARSGAAMAFDERRGVTVLYGGYHGGHLEDTWEWDGASWARREVSGPGPRTSALAYDSDRGVCVLFGGHRGTYGPSGDTWEWDGTRWEQRHEGIPSRRTGASAATDTIRGRTVLFGGTTDFWFGPPPFADTWEWDGVRWWPVATAGPDRRYGAAMAFDSRRGVAVLHGGSDAFWLHGPRGRDFSDTWEWNGRSWRSRPGSPAPSPRAWSASAYDSKRGVTVLFGGVRSWGSSFGDTWEWDGAVWRQRASPGPSARGRAAMAFDEARGVSLLFGGSLTSPDTWEWDGQTWSLRASEGPPARWNPALVFVPERGRVVLFGGWNTSGTLSDAWEWEGSAWRRLDAAPTPPARTHFAWASDPYGGLVLFGGGSGYSSLRSDLWALRTNVRVVVPPEHRTAESGGYTYFQVRAAGTEPLTYQWRKDGTPLRDGGRLGGVRTPTLRINPVHLADAGRYDAVVSNECGSATSAAAELAVTCYPDCDAGTGPGVLDAFDFLCFLNAYGRGDPYACGCDGSTGPGACDLLDFLCFQNAWGRGCP